MMALKVLHLADLHLDTPFRGLTFEEVAPRLQKATTTAFARAIDVALREQVDAVLVAGDVYDRRDRSVRARLTWLAQLERLHAAGIRTFVVHGNHDPLEGLSHSAVLPPSVHTFGAAHEEVIAKSRDGSSYCVQGVSYAQPAVSENLALRFRRTTALPTVGLLHCNVGGQAAHSNYSPCSLADLDQARLDYWALGHVHNRTSWELASGGTAAYPGNLQGRHIAETGARGGLLVELQEGMAPSMRFIPCDDVRWVVVEVQLSSIEALETLAPAIVETVGAALDREGASSLIARVRLIGRSHLASMLKRPGALTELEVAVRERLQTNCFVESIRLEAMEGLDLKSLLEAGGFAAELAEVLEGQCPQSTLDELSRVPELTSLSGALARVRSDALDRLVERLPHLAALRALDALEDDV